MYSKLSKKKYVKSQFGCIYKFIKCVFNASRYGYLYYIIEVPNLSTKSTNNELAVYKQPLL